ncbi:MAG: peptidoglycan-binding domain-containing protein [Tranquillimonas sp.]|jgi:hypothetical protein
MCPRLTPIVLSLVLLAACAPRPLPVARFAEPALDAVGQDIPEGADPAACYGRDETPAVIETTLRDVQVAPATTAADGTRQPAVLRREAQPRIVQERRAIWFETPCPSQMTPDFVASLQRALKVRGLFSGATTGVADAQTRRAVREFQRAQGLNSSVLSIAAAKRLGLVVYDRDEAIAQTRVSAGEGG